MLLTLWPSRSSPLTSLQIIPPGSQDRFGRTYDYQEGTNMMIELGGNYKRWPGVVRAQSFYFRRS